MQLHFIYKLGVLHQQCVKNWHFNFGNSKSEALKRESQINPFADGGLNIIEIRTKSVYQIT